VKQFAIELAAGIIIDATLIRAACAAADAPLRPLELVVPRAARQALLVRQPQPAAATE
jgi:hypothetical protein